MSGIMSLVTRMTSGDEPRRSVQRPKETFRLNEPSTGWVVYLPISSAGVTGPYGVRVAPADGVGGAAIRLGLVL
jgi:hypothetical protein